MFIEGSFEVKLQQYGQMGKQWEDKKRSSEKIREEKEREKEEAGASKSRLAKAAGAEPCGQMSDEKLHAVVARSTCSSQNVQNTPCSDHFWTYGR